MTRILAVADEVDESLDRDKLEQLRPDLVLSCGDLPFDYLEYLVSRTDVPLLYVLGNHDPDLRQPDSPWLLPAAERPQPGPQGCIKVDGLVIEAAGLRVAGLGGSMRYRLGPNQYTPAQMRWRALRIQALVRLMRSRTGRRLDVLLTHAPPEGFGASEDDLAHRGFAAFNRLIEDLNPAVHIHGHIHQHGVGRPARTIGATSVVNAIPHQMVEM